MARSANEASAKRDEQAKLRRTMEKAVADATASQLAMSSRARAGLLPLPEDHLHMTATAPLYPAPASQGIRQQGLKASLKRALHTSFQSRSQRSLYDSAYGGPRLPLPRRGQARRMVDQNPLWEDDADGPRVMNDPLDHDSIQIDPGMYDELEEETGSGYHNFQNPAYSPTYATFQPSGGSRLGLGNTSRGRGRGRGGGQYRSRDQRLMHDPR